MRPSRLPQPGLVLGIALLLPIPQAGAHPRLLVSSPHAEAAVSAPAAISLTFSEPLLAAMSKATLTQTSMPGMNHSGALVPVRVAAGSATGVLLITPQATLRAGGYRLDWRVVSSDTHPISGSLSFTVK